MAHPASETALGPMSIVAAEQYEPAAHRLVRDDLAYHFLPPGVQRIVRLARWRPLRTLLFAFSEKTAPGIWGSTLCRKRFIDDTIRASLGASDTLVNLGAGFDTRAYRLPGLATIPVIEVDAPENSAAKRATLQRLYGQLPPAVRLVPLDFERQDLAAALAGQGYRTDRTSFFVWEAVTQYLSEAAVRKTFAVLAQAAPGSRLVFTYVRKDFIDGVNLYGAPSLYQRFRVRQSLWQFGLEPDQVAAFVGAYGWSELEQVGSAELSVRYLQPAGRRLPVSALERIVSCVKR